MNSLLHVQEQRREKRRPATGAVTVTMWGPRPVEVSGRLVDISDSGFRMAHTAPALETGEVVEFAHAEAAGTALVVWNRVAGDVTETGFFVLT